jgi:putative membrane protein
VIVSPEFFVSDDNDPRIYFAAERTLLAWLRSGLAVMGLGFIVARFGLFLRMIRNPQTELSVPMGSGFIGVALVAIGALMIAVAAGQHVRFCRGLELSQRPRHYLVGMGVWMSVVLAGLGIALAGYLLWSAPPGG